MDINWDSKFPLVSGWSLAGIETFSDHDPILITT
jgi:hypothetical protein